MYEFNRETDPLIKRRDHRWWHFSAQEALRAMENSPMADNPTDIIANPLLPIEERLTFQEKFQNGMKESFPPLPPEIEAQVTIQDIKVPGLTDDEPEVRILVVTPKKLPRGKRPAFVDFFGGGMIAGFVELDLLNVSNWALELKAVGIIVEYRLLPAHPYPAAVNDAEAAVNYVLAHADEFHIDPARMITVGDSAGAYMATCTAQRLRMRGGYQFAGEVLVNPVIDDYLDSPSSKLFCKGSWNPHHEQLVFNCMMGLGYCRSAVPADAIPSHCEDFRGMPPTCIMIGDLDHAHDPAIKYAQGIMNAGIYCDLHIVGGAGHGICAVPVGTALCNRARSHVTNCMEDLMTGKCVHPEAPIKEES